MNLALQQLIEVLRGAWQGRWAGLAVAWLAAVVGCGYIFLKPNQYEASARVYVDTQSILRPLMAGLTIQPNVHQQVAILSRTLISRPNVEKLVRMTDMNLNAASPQQREKLVNHVMNTLHIRQVRGGADLYSISFRDPNRALAQRVVQALLSIFVENGLSNQGNKTGRAQHFIDDQIKAYAQRLDEAENRVKNFKLKHLAFFNSGGQDYFGMSANVAGNIRKTKLELQEALQSRQALKTQLTAELAHPSMGSQGNDASSALATPDFDTRIDTLQQHLDSLLLRYTNKYPDVVNTRAMIKELKKQRAQKRKELEKQFEQQQKADPGSSGAGDPVAQQLKLALADSDAQIAGIRTRLADYEHSRKALLAKAASIPVIEAEYQRLNRNYGMEKNNYDALVQRRETAVMSGQLEQATGIANFRVIDPPRVSSNPVSPHRKVLIPLALLASLCAGFAAAYLFSMVRPTFFDSRQLKTIANRPVLGAISLIRNARVRAQQRRRTVLFFGGVGGLAATYIVALAIVFARAMIPF